MSGGVPSGLRLMGLRKVLLTTVFLGLLSTACHRSSQYHRDKEYFNAGDGADRSGDALSGAGDFGAPKRRLFVLPFENTTPFGKPPGADEGAGRPDDLGIHAADELTREVRATGRAIVPENLMTSAASKDFFAGDKVRVQSLVREGRRLNVSLMVIGRINRVRYRQKGDPVGILKRRESLAVVDLEMRVFDVAEGRELLTTTKSADSSTSKMNLFNRGEAESDSASSRMELVKEAIREGMRLLARDLSRALEKVAWEGRIAKIQGPYIYVNAGKISGLALGDILKVVSPGDDIYDPATGTYMGKSRGQVKGTLEVMDYMGSDGAITRIHSGGGFSENDAVQLY